MADRGTSSAARVAELSAELAEELAIPVPARRGRVTRGQLAKAREAVRLKAVIATATRDLKAIDGELEGLLTNGVTELYFGRTLVADLKDTGSTRLDQAALKIDHPRLFNRYYRFMPSEKISYKVSAAAISVVERVEETE